MKFRSSLDKYRRGKPNTNALANLNAKAPAVVTIEQLSNAGDGVARIDGKAVFVPHTAAGDTVRVEIVEQRSSWSRARVIERLESSPDRVEPRCPYVPACGGCSWQHLSYESQLRSKQNQLLETLQRVGGLGEIPMQAIAPSPTPFHYRNRIRGVVERGVFHFHAEGGEQQVPIERCAIAVPAINDFLKTPDASFSNATGSVELALMDDGAVAMLPVNAERTTELGFRQVNDSVAAALNRSVCTLIENHYDDERDKTSGTTGSQSRGSVLDLYCGSGSWARRIAESNTSLRVLGVDLSENNIKLARRLAANLENVSFMQNQAERVLQRNDVLADTIVVDPPRAGLSDAVVNALVGRSVALLVYVSCHPATLARDLAALTKGSYRIRAVQAFDMFPQTPHVETLAVLEKGGL